MLRFILKQRVKSGDDPEIVTYYTTNYDLPDLQRMLTRGGRGEGCYEVNELVGVEIGPDCAGGRIE